MTASTRGGPSRDAFAAQLASFADRFPDLERERDNAEAPEELTRAYVDLVLAWGLATLGWKTYATDVRERAERELDLRDPVHGYLARALGVRIDQAMGGLPRETPLPAPIGRALADLGGLARYAADRARQELRILEPVEPVDPVANFRLHQDALGAELVECRYLDAAALADTLERLTDRALAESAWGETHRGLLRGVLCFLPQIDRAQAAALLERVASVLGFAQLDLTLLVLQVAGCLRRADVVERAFDRVDELLSERRRLDSQTLAQVLRPALGSVRELGHRHRIRRLVAAAPRVGAGDDPSSLRVRALCAGALAYLGDPAGRAEDWWMAEHPPPEGVLTWSRVPESERAVLLRDIGHMLESGRASVLGDVKVLELSEERRTSLRRGRARLMAVERALDAMLWPTRGGAADRRAVPETARDVALATSFLPVKDALAAFERAFDRLRFVSDSLNVNTYLCVSVVAYVDALVVSMADCAAAHG